MMKKILFAAFAFTALNAAAQDADIKQMSNEANKGFSKDTVNLNWKKGGSLGLNVNQGSLSNWAAGGDKFSLSVNSMASLFAFYQSGKNSWDNSLDLAYGIVKTTSLGKRKASDRIDFSSKYGHAISKKWDVGALLNLRTQFANGYNYLKSSNNLDSAVLTSKTFAPAYVLLSPGMNWKPNADFSLFLSPATARWVIVGPQNLRSFYSVPFNKSVRSEFGAFASANYNHQFSDNLGFKSKLDLFSNYKHDPQNVDIYWTNLLTAKLTKYINFNFTLDMIYDNDTKNVDPKKGPAPQIMQLMGIGFAYNFANYKRP